LAAAFSIILIATPTFGFSLTSFTYYSKPQAEKHLGVRQQTGPNTAKPKQKCLGCLILRHQGSARKSAPAFVDKISTFLGVLAAN
jgi:hypothetical protein